MKLTLYLLVAFGFGVVVAYGVLQRLPSTRHDSQEWGVVGATFPEGASLYGLFESKRECLDARGVFIDEYAAMLGKLGEVKRGSRAVALKGHGAFVMTTFSCLPFSDIRGLPLMPAGSRANRERE